MKLQRFVDFIDSTDVVAIFWCTVMFGFTVSILIGAFTGNLLGGFAVGFSLVGISIAITLAIVVFVMIYQLVTKRKRR